MRRPGLVATRTATRTRTPCRRGGSLRTAPTAGTPPSPRRTRPTTDRARRAGGTAGSRRWAPAPIRTGATRLRMSSAAASNVDAVGTPPNVVPPYSTMPMVTTIAATDTAAELGTPQPTPPGHDRHEVGDDHDRRELREEAAGVEQPPEPGDRRQRDADERGLRRRQQRPHPPRHGKLLQSTRHRGRCAGTVAFHASRNGRSR